MSGDLIVVSVFATLFVVIAFIGIFGNWIFSDLILQALRLTNKILHELIKKR